MNEAPTFFNAPIVRTTDRTEAREAAARITSSLGKIQCEVIDAYRCYGDMTSKTAEALPEFQQYGRSTIQKRISELSQAGILELVPDAPDAKYRLNEDRINNPRSPESIDRCPTCNRALPQRGDER